MTTLTTPRRQLTKLIKYILTFRLVIVPTTAGAMNPVSDPNVLVSPINVSAVVAHLRSISMYARNKVRLTENVIELTQDKKQKIQKSLKGNRNTAMIISGQSNWTKGRIAATHGRSTLFARWRQCVRTPPSAPQSASAPHRTGAAPCRVVLGISTDGHVRPRPGPARFRPQNCPLHLWGRGLPCNTCFNGPTRVYIPNGISIGSAVFLEGSRSWQTVQPTDRSRYSVISNRPHLVLRCGLY